MQPKDNGKHSYLSPNFSKINYAKPNMETVLLNQRIATTQNAQQLSFYHQYSYIYFKPFNKKIISNNNTDTTSEHKSESCKKPLTYKLTNLVKQDKFEHTTPSKLPYMEEIYQKHFKKTELNKSHFLQQLNKHFLSFQYDRYLNLNELLNTIEYNENNREDQEDQTRFYFELRANKIPPKQKNTVKTDKDKKSEGYLKINKFETKNNISFFKMKHIKHVFLQTKLYKPKSNTKSNDQRSKACDKPLQNYNKTIIKDFIITGYLPKIVNNINTFNALQLATDNSPSVSILKDFWKYFNIKPFSKSELNLYA